MEVLSAVLFIFLHVSVALIFVSALGKEIKLSILPRSFVFRQIIYAFLLLPFLDIFARLWLLQPWVSILAIVWAFFGGVFAAVSWLLQVSVKFVNRGLELSAHVVQIAEYGKSEFFSPELKGNWQNLTRSIENVLLSMNTTEVKDTLGDLIAHNSHRQVQRLHDIVEMLKNTTKSPVFVEARKNISKIIVHSLHEVQLTDFNINGASEEGIIFDQFKTHLISVANSFTHNDFYTDENLKPMLLHWNLAWEMIHKYRTILGQRIIDIISNSILPDETKETLMVILTTISGQVRSARDIFSFLTRSPKFSTKIVEMSDAYKALNINPRWCMAILVFTLLNILVLNMSRGPLQSWIQWNLSKTYCITRTKSERTIDGYILTGGLTGIGFGAMHATMQTIFWAILPFPLFVKLLLFTHSAMLTVIHCVVQMGISSAEGRHDLIPGWRGRKRWWVLTTVVHFWFGAYWSFQYLLIIACAGLQIDLMLWMIFVADVIVCAVLAWWAKRICKHARLDGLRHSKRD